MKITPDANHNDDGGSSPADDDEISSAWLQRMKARRAARKQTTRDPWSFVDLDDYLEGRILHEPPTILLREDGKALFYPRKRHLLVGNGESLKTWMVMMAGIQVMRQGGIYLAVDFENSPDETIERLLALGVTKDTLRSYFRLLAPDEALTRKQAETFEQLVAAIRPAFTSVDSVGAGMGLHDFDPNDARDWFQFRTVVIQPVFTATTGAVVAIDHRAKDQSQRTAIGSVQKRNSFDVEIVVEAISPFAPGLTGSSTIFIGKDRAGRLRAASKEGKFFGTLRMTANAAGDEVSGTIEPPSAITAESNEQFAETQHRAAVMKLIESDSERGWRTNEIRLRLNWATTKTSDTLGDLVDLGRLRREGKGRATTYFLESTGINRNQPSGRFGVPDESTAINRGSVKTPDAVDSGGRSVYTIDPEDDGAF